MAKPTAEHWYASDGTAVFEQPKKDGSGMRPTTIRDAKALGLLPSVTSVLKLLSKDTLTDWKVSEAVKQAIISTRFNGEDDKTYISRIIAQSMEQVDEAAKLGTAIHKALEKYFGNEEYDHTYEVYVQAVAKWMNDNGVHPLSREVRLASKQIGVAGTTDLVCDTASGLAIGDFKCSKTVPGKPKLTYEDQKTQIAVYAKIQFGQIEDFHRGFNLYVSPNEPGRIDSAWYDANVLRQEFDVFTHLFEVWCSRKGYDPRRA